MLILQSKHGKSSKNCKTAHVSRETWVQNDVKRAKNQVIMIVSREIYNKECYMLISATIECIGDRMSCSI